MTSRDITDICSHTVEGKCNIEKSFCMPYIYVNSLQPIPWASSEMHSGGRKCLLCIFYRECV